MSTTVIPEPVEHLQPQLDQFPSTQPRGRRLPDSMWQAAVVLAGYTVCIPSHTRYGWTVRRNGSAEFPIADEKHASRYSSN